MTAQEIYDKVLAHLRKQKAASTTAVGACAYRGHEGRMCAVGCLISDDDYRPDMEGGGIGLACMLVTSRARYLHCTTAIVPAHQALAVWVEKHNMAQHSGLLQQLQRAHDGSLRVRGMEDFEREMRNIAKLNNLEYRP